MTKLFPGLFTEFFIQKMYWESFLSLFGSWYFAAILYVVIVPFSTIGTIVLSFAAYFFIKFLMSIRSRSYRYIEFAIKEIGNIPGFNQIGISREVVKTVKRKLINLKNKRR